MIKTGYCLLVILIITVFNLNLNAQGITIGSGTTVSLGSSAIYVDGNWINNGKLNSDNSTVEFNSVSGDQSITSSEVDTFYNFVINKPVGNVILNNNIAVLNNLTISGGQVDANSNEVDLGSTGNLSETPGNTFKNGTITTTRIILGNTSNNIGGLGIVISSGTGLGMTTVSRGHTAQHAGGNSGIKRYFDITPTVNSGLNAKIVFYYDNSELNGFGKSKLKLYSSTDSGVNWTYEGGIIDTGSNSVTKNGIDHFSRLTLADTTSPLPVELTSFTAIPAKNIVKLIWHTETEIKNYGFNIERKNLDKNYVSGSWRKIGFVKGSGNRNTQKDYTFQDNNLAGGTKYEYRLKQIDTDGNFSYSKIVNVKIIPSNFRLYQNYPNPFNPSTVIKYQLPKKSKVKLIVYNINGQKVDELINSEQEAGFYQIKFSARNLASGIYFYTLRTNNIFKVKKMMLVK